MKEIITEGTIKERLNTKKEKEKKNGQDRIREQKEKDEIESELRTQLHETEFIKLMGLVKVEKGGNISCQREGCPNKGTFFVKYSTYGGRLQCAACPTMIDSEEREKIKARYPIFSTT